MNDAEFSILATKKDLIALRDSIIIICALVSVASAAIVTTVLLFALDLK